MALVCSYGAYGPLSAGVIPMAADPDNAGRRQGGRFFPGCSGNLAGKKAGTRHRATRFAEMMMAGDIEAVVRPSVTVLKYGTIFTHGCVSDCGTPSIECNTP
jgi:hypothetical protein